jgi:hypothetical protein
LGGALFLGEIMKKGANKLGKWWAKFFKKTLPKRKDKKKK